MMPKHELTLVWEDCWSPEQHCESTRQVSELGCLLWLTTKLQTLPHPYFSVVLVILDGYQFV
jgi:hypothetical protein